MWKDIKGWEEFYEISSAGEVRNKSTGKLLVGDTNSEGYYRVCLYNKGHDPQKKRFFRHRLVAMHFIPNPVLLPEVNHIDGDLSNNTVENLEWVDKKANELHSRKYGRKIYKPFEVVFESGETKIYESKNDLASYLGLTPHAIKCWLSGHNSGYKNRGILSINYI